MPSNPPNRREPTQKVEINLALLARRHVPRCAGLEASFYIGEASDNISETLMLVRRVTASPMYAKLTPAARHVLQSALVKLENAQSDLVACMADVSEVELEALRDAAATKGASEC